MTGKIFDDSSNVYQDQAKVLFDYYRQAAEKIVGEERRIEDLQKQNQEQTEKALKQKKIFFITMIASAVVALVGLILMLAASPIFALVFALGLGGAITLLIFFLLRLSKLKKLAAEKSALEDEYKNLRRDYKVTKMGVVYVPVATRVPFEGKSFLMDHTGSVEDTEFSLSVLRRPDEFQSALTTLEKGIDKIPLVEDNKDPESIETAEYSSSIKRTTLHDYLGNIDRQSKNVNDLLDDHDTFSVNLPVITPKSERDGFVSEYATEDTEGKPVVRVFNIDTYSDELEAFEKLNNIKKKLDDGGSRDNVMRFKNLMKKMGEAVQIVSGEKSDSSSKLMKYYNDIFSTVLKSAYNQYSPVLEAEEIQRIRESSFDYTESVESYKPFALKESSRVRYDIFSHTWVAEDKSRTNVPFGMNQIQEEIMMPLINNLMLETRIERLKIYNSIKDQKTHYLNEWNKDVEAAFRDNRRAGQELITQITNAYAEYNTAYQTYISYKETQDAMKATGDLESAEVQVADNSDEQIEKFKKQAEICSRAGEEFQSFMNDLQNDIEEKAEEFSHIEYYEASLRDSQSRDIAISQDMEKLRLMDERRQRLIPVSTYCAAFAQIPPAPSTESKLDEDYAFDIKKFAMDELSEIERQERENDGFGAVEEKKTDEETVSVNESADASDASDEGETSDETKSGTEEIAEKKEAVPAGEENVSDSSEE